MNFESRDFENFNRINEVIQKYNNFLLTFGYYLDPKNNVLSQDEKSQLVQLYKDNINLLQILESDINDILSTETSDIDLTEEFETMGLMLQILRMKIFSIYANLN